MSEDVKKLVLIIDGEEHLLERESDCTTFATVPGHACPHCKVAPWRVAGSDMRIGGHDFYTARGACFDCLKPAGEIRAYMSTIFGLEEDARVLHGRLRVY